MKALTLLAVLAASSFLHSARAVESTKPVPETMSVAAFDKGGGPEVLSIHRMPVPKPHSGEVLIAVYAAGVNVWEADYRKKAGSDAHFPVVLGSDGSGTIAAVGPDVHGFKVGDKVYANSHAFYAEYATARVQEIAHIPKGIGLTEAGILATSGLSALQGIDDVLQLKAGETVIIHGATGGVGTLAIQLAKLRHARVLATVSNDEGATLARRLGADAVVNGHTDDITAAARRFAPNGVDAILGLAGGDALERCIDALRKDGGGRVAYLFGMEPLPKPRFGIRMTLYSYVSSSREFERLNEAIEASKLSVPVAAEYSLADAAEAHRRLEAGHLLGKIAIRMH